MTSSRTLAITTALIATSVLVAAFGIGNAVARHWPTPSQSCGPQNAGGTADVYYFNGRTGENLVITYYCDGANWQLLQACDLNPYGLCVAY